MRFVWHEPSVSTDHVHAHTLHLTHSLTRLPHPTPSHQPTSSTDTSSHPPRIVTGQVMGGRCLVVESGGTGIVTKACGEASAGSYLVCVAPTLCCIHQRNHRISLRCCPLVCFVLHSCLHKFSHSNATLTRLPSWPPTTPNAFQL